MKEIFKFNKYQEVNGKISLDFIMAAIMIKTYFLLLTFTYVFLMKYAEIGSNLEMVNNLFIVLFRLCSCEIIIILINVSCPIIYNLIVWTKKKYKIR